MENTEIIKLALKDTRTLAQEAHRNQVDKNGEAYFNHVERVAKSFPPHMMRQRIVGYLHDSLEDTELTLEGLKHNSIPFPEECLEAIVTITKKDHESYDNYIDRVAGNKIATQVKLMDLMDNTSLDRLPDELSPQQYRRYQKYVKAFERLSGLPGKILKTYNLVRHQSDQLKEAGKVPGALNTHNVILEVTEQALSE